MAEADEKTFDMRALMRLAFWGGAASFALLVAVLTGRTETGTERIQTAYATVTAPSGAAPTGTAPAGATRLAAPAVPAPQLAARAVELDNETRRLADIMRTLTAESDRLLTRLATVERNIDDMTGSIDRRVSSSLARLAPPPQIAAPATSPAPSPTPSAADSVMPPNASLMPVGPSFAATVRLAPMPLPPPASFTSAGRVTAAHAIATGDNPPGDSVAARTDFGVDIGGGASVDALRVLWANAKHGQGALFEGLRPVVAIREGKPGAVELRLIIGPLANAGAAARLCAQLAGSGLPCQQTIFDGQKLALR